jgi:hypothetical protein
MSASKRARRELRKLLAVIIPRWSPPTGEYVAEERPDGQFTLDFMEHLNGVGWWDAPVPPKGHRCYAQTRALARTAYVRRCACGAISLDSPPAIKHGADHWLERNSRMTAACKRNSAN